MKLPFFKRPAPALSAPKDADQLLVFVGLGNVGPRFAGTRHNLGIDVLRTWVAAVDPATVWQRQDKFKAEVATVTVGGRQLEALFPLTMMNDSGQAIARYLSYYKLRPQNILIIHEDIELPIGEIRFTNTGSAKGHNGVRSIQNRLETLTIPRLRLGVGRPTEKIEIRNYVLGKFSAEQKPAVKQLVSHAMAELDKLAAV